MAGMSTKRVTPVQVGPSGEMINDLAVRAQKGDRRAINELLRCLRTTCLGVGKQYISIEKDERVQLGWIAIDHCLPKWDPAISSFKTFAKAAIKSTFKDEIRKGRDASGEVGPAGYGPKRDAAFHVTQTDELLETLPSPDFQDAVDQKLDLDAAIATLPPVERQCVAARRLDATMREVAGAQGVSTSRVQTVQNRAIRRLQKILVAAS